MGRSVFLSFLILLGICNTGFAIPAEGTFLPSVNKSIWGVQFNHISARDFNKVEGIGSTTQYFVKISYGLTERLFIDGKVGLGNVGFDRNDDVKLNFPTGFAGGYGFRYLLHDNSEEKMKVLFGFQHISCHPLKDTINNLKHRIIWDEWQETLLFLKTWSKTTVYAGPQYSAVQLKYKTDDFRRRLKGEDVWGAVLGLDYYCNERTAINTEIRLFNEWAFNIGMSCKF